MNDAEERAAAPGHPRPLCEECGRLREQARAALLSGDRSRLIDVRVMEARHRQAEHGRAA